MLCKCVTLHSCYVFDSLCIVVVIKCFALEAFVCIIIIIFVFVTASIVQLLSSAAYKWFSTAALNSSEAKKNTEDSHMVTW